MKIHEAANKLYQQQPTVVRPKTAPGEGTAGEPQKAPSSGVQGYIRIPDNFQPRIGLSREEQLFFEKLFSHHRKQIQAYLKQQQKDHPQKGQYVDVRG